MIFENILKLEDETQGFDEREFNNLKIMINDKQMSLSQIDQQIGAISEKISKAEEQINVIEKAIVELRTVKEYVTNLNEIQTNIFKNHFCMSIYC
jgi:predicted  nucleic acid-binding Zn-ribbon protein